MRTLVPAMTHLIVQLLVNAVSVLIVAALLPGMKARSFLDALGFALVVAILNALVWKVLWLASIPFTVLTLGVGAFILNGLVFLVAQKVVRGVEISGCFVAAIAWFLVSACNAAILALFK